MIKKAILAIFVVLVLVVIVFCAVVAMQPEDFKITRMATMNATPDKVFEQVNDFHKWEAWSPWAKLDPAMQKSYSGAAVGVGSSYAWSGDHLVGEGKMTLTESNPPEHIKMDLDFVKPFAAHNVTEFMLKPDGDKTNVTWTLVGKNNFGAKAFNLVMDMDKLVGGDFEKGLAQMKTIVESAPKQ